MHELLTDAEKEKMTAAGEEFYTEYFAEGENDGDFHAESGTVKPPPLPCSHYFLLTSFPLLSLYQSRMTRTATFLMMRSRSRAAQRIRTKHCA
jgi:hypothetical protein